MERAYLGQTGFASPRIILGCGNFGGIGSAPAFFGQGETPEEAFALMDAAWEAGITTFDTADAYGGGRSETYIGDWLRTKGPDVRDEIVLSTKTFTPMDEGEDHGLAPARVKRQIETSLGRLGVERVDLYLDARLGSRRPDRRDRRRASTSSSPRGRSAPTALSNVDGAQLREALAAGAFAWVQNSYSLLDREAGAARCCRSARSTASASRRSARSRAAGSRASTAAARPAPDGSRMTLRPEPYEHLRTDAVYDALDGLAAAAASAADAGDARARAGSSPTRASPRSSSARAGAAHLEPPLAALDLPLDTAERDALSRLFC